MEMLQQSRYFYLFIWILICCYILLVTLRVDLNMQITGKEKMRFFFLEFEIVKTYSIYYIFDFDYSI